MTTVYISRGSTLGDPYQDSSDSCSDGEDSSAPLRLSPLEQMLQDMQHNKKIVREITAGRRVGFYKIHGEIGCGNFSRVKLGVHALTKDKVAIKILDKTRVDVKTQRLLSREISVMEQLCHPNIIRLYEVVETLSHLYLVMEYAPGGELHAHISAEGRFTDSYSKIVFSQILSGVKHMHDNGIVHRDLKAENVFYSCSGLVKVGDFGFSTFSRRNEMLDTFCGSPPYAAPELFQDDCYVGAYVDVWAMGVILFLMVTGTMPFRADTVPKLRQLIMEGTYQVPPWVPRPCRRLIQGILQPEPAERWALDQMMGCEWLLPVEMPQVSGHPWLDPVHLVKAQPEQLGDDDLELCEALKVLGVTKEHMHNNQSCDSRSVITGMYRLVQHRAQRRRWREEPPVIMQLTSDPRLDRLRAYRHTSKLCVVS